MSVDTTIDEAHPLSGLPCLTRDFAPLPGAIKRRYEDFHVEEIPAYLPCGSGDHTYFTIEKRGLATFRAVQDIATRLGVRPQEIGLAGLKDARGVTIQTLSLEHFDPARLEGLDLPRIRVLGISRHTNKLKVGHLRGNRFRIKLRETEPARIEELRSLCRVLAQRGVPNYFGAQRFGLRGDTHRMGKAVLLGDQARLFDLLLGSPTGADHGAVADARRLYESGDYAAAARAWPAGFQEQARAARALARAKGDRRKASYAIDRRLLKLYVSAYQSHLFNQTLARRCDELDRLHDGEWACREPGGSLFRVPDAAAEAERAACFEISPTGPIFGFRMPWPEGVIGELEREIFDAEQISLNDFRRHKSMHLKGSRRSLRFKPEELDAESGRDEHGEYIELRFMLPAGCYATMLLREFCKDELVEGREGTDKESVELPS